MYREKTSLVPILYYNRLPAEVDSDIAIVLEPMIATGRLCSGGYLMGGGTLTLLLPCVSRHHQRVPDDAEAVGREAHQGALYHRFQAWYARCGRSALVDVLTCIPPLHLPIGRVGCAAQGAPRCAGARRCCGQRAERGGELVLVSRVPCPEPHHLLSSAYQDSYIVPGLGDVGDRLWGTLQSSSPAGDPSAPSAGAGDAGAGSKKRARKA